MCVGAGVFACAREQCVSVYLCACVGAGVWHVLLNPNTESKACWLG